MDSIYIKSAQESRSPGKDDADGVGLLQGAEDSLGGP
jgi:hypothetical protein